MSEVIIKKDGFHVRKWDSTIREYVESKADNPFHELRASCSIEDGITLKDIIGFIALNEDLKKLIGHYAWCDVNAFWKQVQKPCVQKSTLHYIELTRKIKIQDELKDRKTGEVFTKAGEVEEGIYVGGVGADEEGVVVDNWAIELTDVSEMADTPVKLGGVTILDEREQNEDHSYKTVSTSDVGYFTLLEVLGEIMWELSFCGSPCDVADFALNLQEIVEEVKSGKVKTVPFNFDDETIN